MSANAPQSVLDILAEASEFSSFQSLSHVRLFATPWIAPHQAFLSIINSRSSLKLAGRANRVVRNTNTSRMIPLQYDHCAKIDHLGNFWHDSTQMEQQVLVLRW